MLTEKDFEYLCYDSATGKVLVHWVDGAYRIGEE